VLEEVADLADTPRPLSENQRVIGEAVGGTRALPGFAARFLYGWSWGMPGIGGAPPATGADAGGTFTSFKRSSKTWILACFLRPSVHSAIFFSRTWPLSRLQSAC
jgi:hypothetical protein